MPLWAEETEVDADTAGKLRALVIRGNYSNLEVFINQKSSGVFLPVRNTATSKHDWELTNEAENAYLIR